MKRSEKTLLLALIINSIVSIFSQFIGKGFYWLFPQLDYWGIFWIYFLEILIMSLLLFIIVYYVGRLLIRKDSIFKISLILSLSFFFLRIFVLLFFALETIFLHSRFANNIFQILGRYSISFLPSLVFRLNSGNLNLLTILFLPFGLGFLYGLVFGLVLKGCDSLFRLELYATKKPINFGLISGFLSVFVSLSSRNYDFSSLAINSIVNIIISIVFCAFLLMIRKVQRSKN